VSTRTRRRAIARAVIASATEQTVLGADGAVRSVQAADVTMPARELEAIWTPTHLERLARTYWRYISRISLGLLRVVYTPTGRAVVLLCRPFVLLRFRAPEYAMDAGRGIVRWYIEDGVLVSRAGRGGDGYLEIDVHRRAGPTPDELIAHVVVTVANFYPSIASGLSTAVYKATQSRIHVLVTHGFLRSLARLDLAESRVGQLAPTVAEVPDPPTSPQRDARPSEPARANAAQP